MILRPLPLPWPRFVLLCLLLLVAVIGFGCAKKVAVPGKPGVTKPSKKKKRLYLNLWQQREALCP